ncbi:MAG: NUDIX domain-containing protein [Eubacteriales bacterium]|nr:NUDIX domain-containing protein [Eubacteriales bacterium]
MGLYITNCLQSHKEWFVFDRINVSLPNLVSYMYQETKTHEITVDVVIFTIKKGSLQVLLVQRAKEPFINKWAIPGGFVRLSENLDEAAQRLLFEKSNLKDVYLEQIYTFGNPLRYPNSRVITVAYFALIRSENLVLKFDETAENIKQVSWHSVYDLPKLAFDHELIIQYAYNRLRGSLEYSPVAFQLLPKKFTLTELQKAYEIILHTTLDKRNFRKKMVSLNILKELDEYTKNRSKRPARLYMFNEETLNDKKSAFH